jgi:hypothetical protein
VRARPLQLRADEQADLPDLDELAAEDLIRRVPVEGQSWTLFQPTSRGLQTAQQLVDAMTERDIPIARKPFEINQLIAGMTFAQLVEHVYDVYPTFETRSIFRRQLAS